MEKFTTEDLIQEILSWHDTIKYRREGGVVAAELAEARGMAENTARRYLLDDWEAGKLIRERCHKENGHGWHYVYYINPEYKTPPPGE